MKKWSIRPAGFFRAPETRERRDEKGPSLIS